MCQWIGMTRLRDAAWLAALAGMPAAHAVDAMETGSAIDLGAGPGLIRIALNLVFVLAAIVALAFVLRRTGALRSDGQGDLRIQASLALGPKERLLVVEVEGERVLIGASSAGLAALHVLNPSIAVSTDDGNAAATDSASPVFSLPLTEGSA